MAPRVTSAEVQAIVEYDGSTDLEPFITAANLLVTKVCTDSGYADALLKEIERWLAAHFYMMKDQAVAETKAGTATDKYQYKIGLVLKQSKHGQQAMLLDCEGNLASLSKRLENGATSVNIAWLGRDYTTADPTD